jgi:hypothetical protein
VLTTILLCLLCAGGENLPRFFFGRSPAGHWQIMAVWLAKRNKAIVILNFDFCHLFVRTYWQHIAGIR